MTSDVPASPGKAGDEGAQVGIMPGEARVLFYFSTWT
jgi:hypothetical protein